MPIAGRPLLHWPVAAAAGAKRVQAVVIASPATEIERAERIAREAAGASIAVTVVEGGAERADSVRSALTAVDTEAVAVHDAARPLISSEAFDALIALLDEAGVDGAILGTPVFDTVKRAASLRGAGAESDAPVIGETVDRSALWAAQTPQAFPIETLRRAYEQAADRASSATDEASLVEWMGGTVRLLAASGPNFKVTSADDLRVAEALLASGTVR